MKIIDKNKINETVIYIAKKEFKMDLDSSSLNKKLVLDLGLDSLTVVEFIMAIEKTFSIEFPDSINKELNTLQDFIDHISILTANTKK